MSSASVKPSRPFDVRLQKYLADCGCGSRRACERLIEQGRVAVDGRTVDRQGIRIDPAGQVVTIDGKPLRPQTVLHLLLNKPAGYLCTSRDPGRRRTIHDLLPDIRERVYTVGRLDKDSEGAILITNDGDFANRLTHPRYHVPKTYHVWVDQSLTAEDLAAFRRGIRSEGERLRARSVRYAGADGQRHRYELILSEGRKRQIRRMFLAAGVRVHRLRRVAIGPVRLGNLKPGACRALNDGEIRQLREASAPGRNQACV